jgi:hypothetical protein
MSNLRMRLIVTPGEAINYGIKTGTGPSFLRNKTFDEAVYTYQRSCLTETEKCLDDYKLSFANEDKLKELVYYIAVDLSSHALDNFKTFGQNDQSAVCDLSNVYTGLDAAVGNIEYVYKEPLDNLRAAIKSELEAKNVVVSQTSIMANAITARHFQDVYDVFNYNSHN